MSYLSHPARIAVACLLMAPAAVFAQSKTDYATDSTYDEDYVAGEIGKAALMLSERHDEIAADLFARNAELSETPHFLGSRPISRSIESIEVTVRASHLMHYQAIHGSLGALHGSSEHPIGLGWFPHSMFSQDGGTYGRWGHALLLAAVNAEVNGDNE